MSLLENVTKHFASRRSLRVPEWDATIFWSPLTAREQASISGMSKGMSDSSQKAMIRMLVAKAEDSEGKKLFEPQDIDVMVEKADFTVIGRLVGAMTGLIDSEEVVKN